VIEEQADLGPIGTLDFDSADGQSAGAGGTGSGARAAAFNAAGKLLGATGPAAGVGGSASLFGTAAGLVFPGIGTLVGTVVGGLVGAFLLSKGSRVTAESRAAEAIEQACALVEGQAPRLLEAQAREALTGLRRQLENRLDTEREQLARIEEMLQEHASKKEDMKKRAGAALAQVRGMLTDTNAKS
jgi:hypothetical protein